jgi:hypothetical protein
MASWEEFLPLSGKQLGANSFKAQCRCLLAFAAMKQTTFLKESASPK